MPDLKPLPPDAVRARYEQMFSGRPSLEERQARLAASFNKQIDEYGKASQDEQRYGPQERAWFASQIPVIAKQRDERLKTEAHADDELRAQERKDLAASERAWGRPAKAAGAWQP